MKRVCVMGISCGRGNELAPEYPAISVNAFGAPLSPGSSWDRHGYTFPAAWQGPREIAHPSTSDRHALIAPYWTDQGDQALNRAAPYAG